MKTALLKAKLYGIDTVYESKQKQDMLAMI